jgi:iron complex outermembrane recepter protein
MYKADIDGRKIDQKAFGGTAYVQNSIRFGKTWTAELTGVFVAPTLMMGTFETKAMGGVDIGLQKQIFKGNGTIKIAGTDIFQTFRFKASSDFAGQTTNVLARWESRQFKANFTWRFGSTTVKAAKQRSTAAEDESKRAAQSGGGIGIGQ